MISAERAVHNWDKMLPDIQRVAEWERQRRNDKLDPNVPLQTDAATPAEARGSENGPLELPQA